MRVLAEAPRGKWSVIRPSGPDTIFVKWPLHKAHIRLLAAEGLGVTYTSRGSMKARTAEAAEASEWLSALGTASSCSLPMWPGLQFGLCVAKFAHSP